MGIKVPHWQLRDQSEVVVEWNLGLLADETAYPFRLHCEQYKLAPLLYRRLLEVGGAGFRDIQIGVRHDGRRRRELKDKLRAGLGRLREMQESRTAARDIPRRHRN
jgi:hypothetical protein